MGLNIQTLQLLKNSEDIKKGNLKVLTIGRQAIRFGYKEFSKIEKNLNFSFNAFKESIKDSNGFCESLLKSLFGWDVESLDISDYENCSYLHNMNQDIKENKNLSNLIGRYDLILDLGSTEHIFNSTQSIVNSLNLLKKDGLLILSVPVTGTMEHGLYQFSQNFFDALSNSKFIKSNTSYYQQSKARGKLISWEKLILFIEKTNLVIYSFAKIRKKNCFDEKEFKMGINDTYYEKVWNKTNMNTNKSRKILRFLNKYISYNSKRNILKFMMSIPLINKYIAYSFYRI